MHLYTFSQAPNPQRLGYFIKYKGLDIPTTEVNIREKEQFSDEFKLINPSSTLPALVLKDGTVLTDTISICVYLDKYFPEKSLFGSNPTEYAQVIGWTHKIYVEGLAAVAEILRNESEFFKDRALPGRQNIPQLDVLIERGKLRLAGFWEDLNDHLLNHKFLVGEQLTLADIDAYVICSFAGWVKETVPEHCTNITKWHRKVLAELED
ncbi:MAG: glutathione S-transferase [Gammaproteobacteria bacterium]|nr:MAG: glutathione S-transferase [Gammaproteobacteria bacterium]